MVLVKTAAMLLLLLLCLTAHLPLADA